MTSGPFSIPRSVMGAAVLIFLLLRPITPAAAAEPIRVGFLGQGTRGVGEGVHDVQSRTRSAPSAARASARPSSGESAKIRTAVSVPLARTRSREPSA